MNESLAGRLLVASPSLLDPNFHRSVVLVCAHGEEGAFGVVLNRPLDADVLDHVPEWRHRVASPPVIFEGGPVEQVVAVAVGRNRAKYPGDGWTSVAGEVGLLDLSKDPADFGGELEKLRVFSGYAGWGVGQVEAEIEEGSWFVVDSDPEDPFTGNPDRLWHDVLRRQPGQLAMYALFPPDASLN